MLLDHSHLFSQYSSLYLVKNVVKSSIFQKERCTTFKVNLYVSLYKDSEVANEDIK